MSASESEMLEAAASYPRYQCEKQVRAAKITAVQFRNAEQIVVLLDGFMPATLPTQGRPTPAAGWYLVVYEDGYTSFSPPAAFEDGYVRIDPL